jgi:uncharacterized Ntn-hydrolase superfamily protein
VTYSLVAFDPDTGEHGAAVHSHWFSVGSLCIWARPASARSRRSRSSSRPTARTGSTGWRPASPPRRRCARCSAPTSWPAVRQVGIVDGAGEVAVHTGESCIPCAGHATGAHVSAQANMMERETVPAAMVAGFEAATGDLADR